MPPLQRVLVANRGEIAVRIIRACIDEGVESVAIVSEADRESMAAYLADQVVCIGPGNAAESYLDLNRVISAAVLTQCDALHPGYGFLAERPELVEICNENGIVFIGPSADAIRRGGDKVQARALAQSLGISTGAGSSALVDVDEAELIANQVGFPVLMKAAAGGGGRGMVLVEDASDIRERFASASNEALQAFGDGRLYIERFISRARHVEVQILADSHGNVVHLGERDCTAQRRYQKVVEEAPANFVAPAIRAQLHDAAIKLARGLNYVGAATVEFIVDAQTGDFSFLEVNTRVQVEHPVTEMLTGIDIVREQLRIAGGQPLSFGQSDVVLSGHAIECRLNAEDPEAEFLPSPGRVTRWIPPVGEDIRVDSHVYGDYVIPPYYDSMIAKVIAHSDDRTRCLAKMDRALGHMVIDGVSTNRNFLRDVIQHPDFVAGDHHTRWVEQEFLAGWADGQGDNRREIA
ncbi:MAG: acetyl-CoA carboxylase biotin carboxylase subunit [Candidatus Nanopelagicales bacterium]